jgi:hypothetical protein
LGSHLGKVLAKEAEMRNITRCASLALVLVVMAAFLSAPVVAAPREKTRMLNGWGPGGVFVAMIAPWKVFGPEPAYKHRYHVNRHNYAPTSTPVRLRPDRRFYIGPHYKSRYGPGYHTNGPGIGIER